MSKLIICFAALLLPVLTFAQYMPGTFVLTGDPSKRYSEIIRIRSGELAVKDSNGKVIKYKPGQILSATTADNRKFIAVSGFVAMGMNSNHKLYGSTLVELIDSGKVCLTRFNDFASSSFSVSNSSGFYDGSLYIVKSTDAVAATTLPGYVWTNRGKKLYDVLRLYVADRPDLL